MTSATLAPAMPRSFMILAAAATIMKERGIAGASVAEVRSEEHTSELQSHLNLVCRLLLEKKKKLHACAHGGLLLCIFWIYLRTRGEDRATALVWNPTAVPSASALWECAELATAEAWSAKD